MKVERIVNDLIEYTVKNTNDISDGYHTFGELYAHRIELYLSLARMVSYENKKRVWMSQMHFDGGYIPEWFILGINMEEGDQITYHIPKDRYKECAKFCVVLDRAPEFDGHSSSDVLDRLRLLERALKSGQ